MSRRSAARRTAARWATVVFDASVFEEALEDFDVRDVFDELAAAWWQPLRPCPAAGSQV